ncbi:MAG: acyltransferase [Casimicrobiaceae bacterium]
MPRFGSTPAVRAPTHVAALDGLRGFAVLLVFCVHAAGNAAAVITGLDLGQESFLSLPTWPQRVLFWLQRSHHGVFLFFVLSGFLIGRMWWPQPQASYARFAWRRTLRIYPAFLLSFVASMLFVRFTGPMVEPDLPRVLGNLIFLNGMPGATMVPLNIVTWSLFYEMTFYIGFPLLVLAALLVSPRLVPAIPMVGVVVPLALALAGADALVLCWALLFFGVALALWQDRLAPALSRIRVPVVVAAYLAVTTGALFDATSQVAAIMAFGLVAVMVLAKTLAGDNALAAVFATRPLVLLGHISYSFYLLHWMIVVLVARAVTPHGDAWGALPATVVIFGAGFVLSVAAAAISWWVAERPYFARRADVPASRT